MDDDIKAATLMLGALIYRDAIMARASSQMQRESLTTLSNNAIEQARIFVGEAERLQLLPEELIMADKKHTPKQAAMQAVIDRLVAVCGELQDIQASAMPSVTRFPARAPHAVYSSTFLDNAINSTDDSINAMISQLGEKNLR